MISRRNGSVKGQMVFQFIIAAVIFFAIVLYTLNFLNSNVNSYWNDMFVNELENKAVSVSEVLVKSRGVWDGNTPKSIGLVDDDYMWPVLKLDKIKNFINFCFSGSVPNENEFNILGLNGYGANITISSATLDKNVLCISSDSQYRCSCGYPLTNGTKMYIKRYGLVMYSGAPNPVAIDVWLWKK